MIHTDVGLLDGDRWEKLIQLVFKKRYDTYQDMVASPGDLGIEGFVMDEGIMIQCYCPDEEYSAGILHEKQRDKMTADIGKLAKNEEALIKHIGDCKISQWLFITPRIGKHDIHAHARKKEAEVKEQGLSFIADDFQVLVKDLDYYIQDIRQQQVVNGEQLCFTSAKGEVIPEPELTTEYDENIDEKNEVRSYINKVYKPKTHQRLNELTKKLYLDGYDILRRIFIQSPDLYERIAKLVNKFEDEVEEVSMTWEDSPQRLVSSIEEKLIGRFEKDPYISTIEYEDLVSITKHMVARWIAECPMRIES
ncbi:hypothetical protein WM008_00260 [Vibrio vulnificus]|uniref:hypothetical protein n=2 Tax=Vibrio vulnificus TaxID=672 RepID=UPI001028A204|nr:hypothetical protein [Vibrio vulnificus]EGQ9932441.1 hypothetical protein [Vibrio vulnificus]EGR0128109.1 hypothetical protein [Vibrio vulnificus]EHZ7121498.1 hypothetical protein [Vibrio vulnificus]EKO5190601.1 hypothetical protein [Vibrio vulnificus]ELI0611119.1 hypothetical protein [Vibrio vulnificus]